MKNKKTNLRNKNDQKKMSCAIGIAKFVKLENGTILSQVEALYLANVMIEEHKPKTDLEKYMITEANKLVFKRGVRQDGHAAIH